MNTKVQSNTSHALAGAQVLVTGGTGFVGKHLLSALIARECDVTCLTRTRQLPSPLATLPIRWLHGDLRDASTLPTQWPAFDAVFHLAGVLGGTCQAEFDAVNVLGTAHLYTALSHSSPLYKSVVHVSSIAAAGPSNAGPPKREDDEAQPVSLYGRSKLDGEAVARSFSNQLPIVIVRPTIVYGPGDHGGLFLYRMVDKQLVFRPPGQPKYFNMIHVADLVNALIRAAERGAAIGETIHIASEEVYSWDQVTDLIAAALQRKPRSISVGKSALYVLAFVQELSAKLTRETGNIFTRAKVPEILAEGWLADTTKAKQLLDFTAQAPLVEGIRETSAWYRHHNWL